MKRILTCALALMMLASLSVPAFADVMWEPMDDSFYERHRSTCHYENRRYYANGKDGFVTIWDAPDGSVVRAQYENGVALWVGYTYKDWALISRWEDNGEISGWTPMKDLYLIYDHISFEEEYGGQFRDYDGEFAGFDGEVGGLVQLWEYPGASEEKETLTLTQDFLDALRGTPEQRSYISKVYTDENGNRWGYVAYMYGLRNFWICMDNTDGIMSSCVPTVDSLIESGELTAPREPVPPSGSYLPYILVAAVVAVTAGLLAFFYGRRKKSTD